MSKTIQEYLNEAYDVKFKGKDTTMEVNSTVRSLMFTIKDKKGDILGFHMIKGKEIKELLKYIDDEIVL